MSGPLVLIELDGGAPADASLRALTLGRSLDSSALGAVVFADSAAVPADALAAYGVTDVYVIEPGSLDGYAPQAWARTLAGLASETGATAVLAAGTDRGNEVLAHLGAITGLPMAANCTLVTPDGGRTHRLVRHRWAGLLLYLACGISGAIQHIAGCAGAKHIIAINTDPGAPILAHADYAITGDLHQVIPALIEALRAR